MKRFSALLLGFAAVMAVAQQTTNQGVPYLLSQSVDMSQQFLDPTNTVFCADSLVRFNPATGEGLLRWSRHEMHPRQAFNANGYWITPLTNLDFPGPAYDQSPELAFRIEPINARTVRVRIFTSPILPQDDPDELMLVSEPKADMSVWQARRDDVRGCYVMQTANLTLEVYDYPWRLVLRDASGKELTHTRALSDNDSTQVKTQPFMFIKRGSDNSRSIEPVFSLRSGERIFGCGESALPLNKVGQKLNLFVTDPQGPETPDMYKPIPFYFSSRGYGVFMHTSAPVTVDFGQSYIGSTRLFMADEVADLFLFVGNPKEILGEYTNLVGRPQTPPLWSFGLWQSRISYFTEAEGRHVAATLREKKIPADVIHFDTGWFETDWQCDYQFSHNFENAERMLADLKADGFHTCLWQLPYFTPKNRYFGYLVENGMAVKNGRGGLPFEDAVLDFSNPATVDWYQGQLAGLLRQGVSVIKVDFGEAAPYLNGLYHSGKSGLYEHNLYPLRYNKAAYDIIRKTNNGEGIIWARSAWAGSQRFPLHWGGDAATTDAGLLGTIREGLSFGLSGFSFWSHDIGGFVTKSPENLYRRWLPFGLLTSHSRVHGVETEPWLYDDAFVDYFRKCVEMRYRLMPYIYSEAQKAAAAGLPMVRALLLDFPEDPGAWMIEDEYMFGESMLVAPMMEEGDSRLVYLPGNGKWVDYQTGKTYSSGWQQIACGELPIVILVRKGATIETVPVAQSTDRIEWNKSTTKKY